MSVFGTNAKLLLMHSLVPVTQTKADIEYCASFTPCAQLRHSFHTLKYFCVYYSLLVYSSGLFPLLGHGSMSVRPALLDVYERYYLAVGRGLVPCLSGMVLGLLPGLEDESEHTERFA